MKDPDSPLLAGIEAGGTKIVCAVATDPGTPLLETRFPTGEPENALEQAATFFRDASEQFGPLRAMGIGTFGPADIDPASPSYGGILTTPKEGWSGFDLVGTLREALPDSIPIAFDTDVNAAAIGEFEFGAGKQVRHLCYITVGTGIGGGVLIDGLPLHGRLHPEIGHMLMPNLEIGNDNDTNVCPFHESCLEGRASGPAIQKRWGSSGVELGARHPAWELEASYLAHGAVNLTAAWSPDRILLGGGVLQQPELIEQVRRKFENLAGDYWSLPPLESYLQTPGLDQEAGIVGALTMAQRLL